MRKSMPGVLFVLASHSRTAPSWPVQRVEVIVGAGNLDGPKNQVELECCSSVIRDEAVNVAQSNIEEKMCHQAERKPSARVHRV
jgi:hypothetical protein